MDFAATRRQFEIPNGLIYLDGNSLGPLPKGAAEKSHEAVAKQWGESLISGWNRHRWMEMPLTIGNKIAPLIGVDEGTVVVGETLSLRLYQALAGALAMRPLRRIIISDSGNFPTDLYMAEGLIKTMGRGHQLKIVAPQAVADAVKQYGEDLACLMLTEVDYRSGRRHNMAQLTALAHDVGAVALWDLAHSAGALPVALKACEVDMAVGCSYKYLNGGPGAPAFIYIRQDWLDKIECALAGWLGHAAPFAFESGYRPASGIARMRIGTPAVIQNAILDVALNVWQAVDMDELRHQSLALTAQFAAIVGRECPALRLITPMAKPEERGSQLAFLFDEGFAVIQALISQNIIGDYREPSLMRFGFAPLYNTMAEVETAASRLCQIIRDKIYLRPEFQTRGAVT